MVNVSVVVPFSAMLGAPNIFAIDGGASTDSVAVLLVVPKPPSFEKMAFVVLGMAPPIVPLTSAFNVQVALDPSVPPMKPIALEANMELSVPPQPFVVLITTRPVGSGSM